MQVEVDVLVEGSPALAAPQLEQLEAQLAGDCERIVRSALARRAARDTQYRPPAVAALSVVLCCDPHIQQLNAESRGKDAPTDVLSFELPDEPGLWLPVKLLGDLVVSLDTAERQALERGHSLLDEVRVLLVHGALHLTGLDHERSEAELALMAAEEAAMLEELGWQGRGLIEAAGAGALHADSDEEAQGGEREGAAGGGASSGAGSSSGGAGGAGEGDAQRAHSGAAASTSGPAGSSGRSSTKGAAAGKPRRSSDVRLVALDLDGTLLNSSSRIAPPTAAAVRAAIAAGVTVICATGKARPAAIAAASVAQLASDQLLVSTATPGVFLQGLAVHGVRGSMLSDAQLPAQVVRSAFEWAAGAGVSCVAFLGDECATLRLTPELRELHHRYYEPLAQQLPDLDSLLAGPPVRKLLFMANPGLVESLVKPHWTNALGVSSMSGGGSGRGGATLLQAVPDMLEVVPSGVDKWAGLEVLLSHLGLPASALMAVGDGSNDLGMVANAGVGVAMGNAVPAVREAAAWVVGSNDEGGVAEAIERFVL